MIDLLPYALMGIGFGTIAGFVPGIGIFATLMILYPFLMDFTGLELVAFYVGISSTTQYIGSITATVFAIPGESSSLPSVKEGHALYKQGQGAFAISGAAIGSFVGSLLVLLITSLFVPQLENLYYLYSSYVQAIIISLVICLLILSSKSKIYAVFLSLLGYALGSVGCRIIDEKCFASFNNGDLETGLPLVSVLLALYVVPIVLNNWNLKFNYSGVQIKSERFTLHLKKYIDNIGASLRGTLIGFFAGFTPGLSTAMSSNLSYAIEKYIQRKEYKEGNYKALISAETGNNAGAFACLLPLIVLGIPIVPSEALLYDLAVAKGFSLGGENFNVEFFNTVAYILVFVNFIALLIAWPFAKYICYLGKLNYKLIQGAILIAFIFIIGIVGSELFQSTYYLLTFFVLLPVGILLRKHDTLPLVFAFIVADRIAAVSIPLENLIIN